MEAEGEVKHPTTLHASEKAKVILTQQEMAAEMNYIRELIRKAKETKNPEDDTFARTYYTRYWELDKIRKELIRKTQKKT
jgi:hypothetical protein